MSVVTMCCQLSLTKVEDQCSELATVVDVDVACNSRRSVNDRGQFITLSIQLCVQYDVREALCIMLVHLQHLILVLYP